MFMGEYVHAIDVKGRVILPADFRAELGVSFIITKAGMGGAGRETAAAAARQTGGTRARAFLLCGSAYAGVR